MKVPAAATQIIDNFKTKGTLGQGAERMQFTAEQATEMDEFSKTIDYTTESDNEPGFDYNPKKGELLLKDAAYTTEITVSGDSKQGNMMEITQFKNPSSQGVIFLEATQDGFVSLMANVTNDGGIKYAEAAYIDRKDPSKSYAERIGA